MTRTHRRVREVATPGGDRVEAALDLGEIETKDGCLPIAEIELELLEGEPAALFRLALELQKVGPLCLQTRSKSARAFDRLSGQPPSWHRAMAPSITPNDSVDEAMAAIFESCFQQWLSNQAAAIDGRDPEGVHQLRVALRRLRSALSVFQNLIPKSQLAALKVDAKQTLDELAPARDWDVFRTDILAPVIEMRADAPDLKALDRRANACCRASYRRARKHLESAGYTRFVVQFGLWLEQRAWRRTDDTKRAMLLARPITAFAGKLLTKRHKRVLSKGRCFSSLSTEQRHALRIDLKKLRYSIEFFQPLFSGKAVKPFRARVKALQEDLGILNDVAVAETLMAELLARPAKRDIKVATGLVVGWHVHRIAAADPELRRAWKSFAGARAFWR